MKVVGIVCVSGAYGWASPANATASSVASAIAPRTSAVRAICGIFRYSESSTTTPAAIASRCVGTAPLSDGTRYAAYCANPI
ncbi:MAG TPA: hypothetical protein VK669_10815 [Candidatus Limnocylindrales bacterium]|nr:hypothetical protein [Candidatus Limnocylindrales bacterium]